MGSRLELNDELKEMLGSNNVYYQPPESIRMEYDAIRYSRKNLNTKYANDKLYSKMNCYEIIVISKKPNNPVIDKLLEMPYCSFDRHYIADNLNHDVLTLYY